MWDEIVIISEKELKTFLSRKVGDPHAVLGMRKMLERDSLVVRAFLPGAERVDLFDPASTRTFPLSRIDEYGFFEGEISRRTEVFPYLLRSYGPNGAMEFRDPYSFLPTTSNEDLSPFNKGLEIKPHEKLGAIPREFLGETGVSFVLWAPYAEQVFLIGDFNHWNEGSLPMRPLGPSGCWELFVPFASPGQKYKFCIHGADGNQVVKADPFAAYCELPPGNASIIHDFSSLASVDFSRLEMQNPTTEPLSVYEIHLGSWRRSKTGNQPLSYLELSEVLPVYVDDLGFTHIEFLPPAEHPFTGSWGYQITGFYAPTSRFGTPEEFGRLVAACHEAGLGVILDWVPGHFPTDEFGLARFDGSCLFEHEDPRKGFHADWGTLVFNYGRPEVRSFLFGSAFSWLDRYGVDGFRVDAVASMLYLDYSRNEGEWLPNEKGGRENIEAIDFFRQFHDILTEEYPGVLSIAEESTAFPKVTESASEGGLGFNFKWNMGWMHDVLAYLRTSQSDRPDSHGSLTFGATYQFSEDFIQAFSHDEVVHGKGSLVNKMKAAGQAEQIAQLRALYALQWAWPGKKTLFMGGELAQWKEWDCDGQLDWSLLKLPVHFGVSRLLRDLNNLYRERPFWAMGDCNADKFQWISSEDAEGRTLSFVRYGETADESLVVVCNFAEASQEVTIGCPHAETWIVILDTADPKYDGSRSEKQLSVSSEKHRAHGFDQSLKLCLESLSVVLLEPSSLGGSY